MCLLGSRRSAKARCDDSLAGYVEAPRVRSRFESGGTENTGDHGRGRTGEKLALSGRRDGLRGMRGHRGEGRRESRRSRIGERVDRQRHDGRRRTRNRRDDPGGGPPGRVYGPARQPAKGRDRSVLATQPPDILDHPGDRSALCCGNYLAHGSSGRSQRGALSPDDDYRGMGHRRICRGRGPAATPST